MTPTARRGGQGRGLEGSCGLEGRRWGYGGRWGEAQAAVKSGNQKGREMGYLGEGPETGAGSVPLKEGHRLPWPAGLGGIVLHAHPGLPPPKLSSDTAPNLARRKLPASSPQPCRVTDEETQIPSRLDTLTSTHQSHIKYLVIQ